MVFRLLCYLVALWKGFRAQHPRARKLPPILALVKVAGDERVEAANVEVQANKGRSACGR